MKIKFSLTLFLDLVHTIGVYTEPEFMREDGYSDQPFRLRMAHVLFRHGDRSPTGSYANDIYTEDDWPQGFGQLSIKGMRQEYNLGMFLRNRYMNCVGLDEFGINCNGFIQEQYSRNEVYVRSTDMDRTLMSAYSVLSALFPPLETDNSKQFETEFNLFDVWQPIPVHTKPAEKDYLLRSDALCPFFDTFNTDEVKAQTYPKLQKIQEEHSEFFKIVSENSGEPNNWTGLAKIMDPLFCQKVSGYQLPEWVTDEIFDEMMYVRQLHTEFWIPEGYAYLKGGTLVQEVTKHMVNYDGSDGSEPIPHRLNIYSAHDTTIVALLQTMQIFNNQMPPYTACVLIELLESGNALFAQILYRNDTETTPYILTLPGCQELCPLHTFVDIFQDILSLDIEAECMLDEADNAELSFHETFTASSTAINMVLVCIIFVTMIVFTVLCVLSRDKKRDSVDYMPVPTEMTELESI